MSTDISQRLKEVDCPSSKVIDFGAEKPLLLDSGIKFENWRLAYQSYGKLNDAKSNAILICHALTGDHYVADENPITGKPGWWQLLVGPGKAIDTDRFFVICSNVIGSCMGSTGPASLKPNSLERYGIDFPVITIGDMVRAQTMLLDALDIEKLFSVVGGSMGGMQVLEWGANYPHRVFSAIPIATAVRHSSQNIAFHEVGRQAVMADPDWRGGNYLKEGTHPSKGLAVARMAAHITYLSEPVLFKKFDRRLQNRDSLTYGFDADFQVESYLRHQGMTFVDRFDANAYLYLTRAMDYFDLSAPHGGNLALAFKNSETRFCVVSFTSDWLFPTSENRSIVHTLNAVSAPVSFVEIESDRGHDAFLLDEPEFFRTINGFLSACANTCGL